MRNRPAERALRPIRAASLACLILLGFALSPAHAADVLGPYLVGATLGQAHLDVTTPVVSDFGSDHAGFQLMVGIRPIPEFGVELSYVDFGHPHETTTAPLSPVTLSTDATIKGAALFGVLYLPTPTRVDFYLKGGMSRLTTSVNTAVVGCTTPGGMCAPAAPIPPQDSTDYGLAGGVGVQFVIRTFGLRAEYERFTAGGGNPYLVQFGAVWAF